MKRALLLACLATAAQADPFITVQSTTSTQNSGLYDAILPAFTQMSGIEVRVVAVGTGQAIRNARNCDGDVLIVHALAAEEAFVADGYGLARRDVMYNDFVLVGPARDPADLETAADIQTALTRIPATGERFVSRGDDSGTHQRERRLWPDGPPDDPSYVETGQGMGSTLNIAAGMAAHTLTDRATWLTFANRADLAILFEGDPALFNQYGVIVISPEACPTTKLNEAQAFADWLTAPEGQRAIADYTVDGTQLFIPNAAP